MITIVTADMQGLNKKNKNNSNINSLYIDRKMIILKIITNKNYNNN